MANKKYTLFYIKKLLEQHGSITAIERATGIAMETCATYLKQAGIKYVSIKRTTPSQQEAILKKYAKYRDRGELSILANELGIKYDNMKIFARRNGLTDLANNGKITANRHRIHGHPMVGKN